MRFEIAETFDIAGIDPEIHAAHLFEEPLRNGRREHTDGIAFEVLHPHQAPGVLGPRHHDALLVVGGEFEPIEDNVEVAAFQGGNKLVPLHHPGLYPELCGEQFSQLAFETDEQFGFSGIRINVGRAAFGIGTPEQDAAASHSFQSVRGNRLGLLASRRTRTKLQEVTRDKRQALLIDAA